jgi:predicted exporter
MIRWFYHSFSLLSVAWFLLILALAAYDVRSLFFQKNVQFDLMALLPESRTEGMSAAKQLMEEVNLIGRVLILVGHQDAATSRFVFELLRQEIKQASLPLKEQTSEAVIQDYNILFKKLYPYRAGLLAESDRNLLLNGEGNVLTRRALSNIMVPFASLGPVQFKSDPFFLYPSFVTSLQPPGLLQNDEKGYTFIKADGKIWYLFKALLTEPAFSLHTQKEFTEKLVPFLNSMQQRRGVDILKTGAIFYSAAGSTQANAEISQIGLISTLAIILMLLVIFKTFRALFFAIAIITSGLIGGLAVCFFIFGSVHILALVFGCSLVGVTVDYALHYFCASYKRENTLSKSKFAVLESLMPALLLGVSSSILGYSLLIMAPFPGIQQMAVLAAVGLFFAFLSVCLWGPYFIQHSKKKIPPLGKKIQAFLDKVAEYGQLKHARRLISIFLISVFCAGAVMITFEDDIRNFQSLDVGLKHEEDRIRSMMTFDTASKFLTLRGSTLEDVLQLEENIRLELDKMLTKGEIASYRSLSNLVPSKKRQQENRQLLKEQLYQKEWNPFIEALGLQQILDPSAMGLNAPFLTTLDKLPEGFRELVHFAKDEQVVGRIFLQDVNNAPALEKLISKYEGIHYIDPPREYTSLFSSYRQVMMGLVLTVFFGITFVLSFWKGIKVAVNIVFPVALSLLTTVGVIALTCISFNLFHVMGLLLILCIGIDYALFLYWREPSDALVQEKDLLLLANGLAALTTILSFGLLAFSKTEAIHSFGLTVFIGIFLSFCVTTLFLGKGKC